jgi:aconitate hydratase
LQLKGDEAITLSGLEAITAGMEVVMEVKYPDGSSKTCSLQSRLDTALEVAYFLAGGIMPYVVEKLGGDA